MGPLNEANSVLLVFCGVLLILTLLSTMGWTLSARKNASLNELFHVESKRHTQELLSLNERRNEQLYNYQEKVQIEHVATLRQLLESFSIAASGKPDA